MSTAELKSNLHKLIVETDDINILIKIQDIFTALRSESTQGDALSDYEKQMIEQGLKDIEQGNIIPHQDVKDLFKKWVNEKQQ
jgi:predicted transcriptional regulator